jgi:hypothetical protein
MLILYSTNTFLAYSISEKYYGSLHYFWCTPHFDSNSLGALSTSKSAPSSSPAELYEDLIRDILRGDRHSTRVTQNRSGIITGATVSLSRKFIARKQFNEIVEIVRAAELKDFRPLLFVGAYDHLKKYLRTVAVSKRANPLSDEFIAQDVRRDRFDVIELPWRR